MQILAVPTAPGWLPAATADLDALLRDHAHCERKAAAAAMSLVAQYPQHGALVDACVALAQEELRHFRAVHALLRGRGLALGRDGGDPYVQALLGLLRHGAEDRLLDRLLVNALVEARACERLGLLGGALRAPLNRFYARLARAEAGHSRLFVRLAAALLPDHDVAARLGALAAQEAHIVQALPALPRIH